VYANKILLAYRHGRYVNIAPRLLNDPHQNAETQTLQASSKSAAPISQSEFQIPCQIILEKKQ
jgi:hypothetical protein